MAANLNTMTLNGNLAADPELRYTPGGQAVASFRIANTPRYMDKATQEWKDGETLWQSCTLWGPPAENLCESAAKGTAVLVTGKLKQRSYETKEGEKRTVYDLVCDDVAVSIMRASVKVTRSTRSAGDGAYSGGGQGYGGGQQQAARPADDPWAVPANAAAGGSGFTDEPPF